MPNPISGNRGALRKADLREANQRLFLNIIRENSGASRADIVRITGFSPSSVTYVVNRMLKLGLVSESRGTGPAQVGRQPVMLQLQPQAMIAVGVEISQEQSRVVTSDLLGNILGQRSVRWRRDPQLMLAGVHEAISSLTGNVPASRILGAGISLPGTIDRNSGRVIAAEQLGWFDVDAGTVLSRGLPFKFYFENDARLGALAERWFVKPGTVPLSNFVFVELRSGLGTGVMIEGRLLCGASGEASEFGHTSLFPDGRRCPCGGTGCWEEYASQRALERLYKERATKDMDAAAIIQLARDGDPLGREVLREIAKYLGMGFANLNAAFNPEAIIVGDYLASAWDVMGDWVESELRNRGPQRFLSRLRVLPSHNGRDSALKGALAVVLSHFFADGGGTKSTATLVPHPTRRSA